MYACTFLYAVHTYRHGIYLAYTSLKLHKLAVLAKHHHFFISLNKHNSESKNI